MATQISELAAELTDIKMLVSEGMVELTGKINDLEEALGNAGELPVEVVEAMAALRRTAQALADRASVGKDAVPLG